MGQKYQTSFEYQLEEKRMGFFKLLLALIIIIVGGAAVYAWALPSEKRMNWFNVGMEQVNKYYEDSIVYLSEYIPILGDITGVKPTMPEITSNPNQTAPLKQEAPKVKVYRSNQNRPQ